LKISMICGGVDAERNVSEEERTRSQKNDTIHLWWACQHRQDHDWISCRISVATAVFVSL